MSQIYTVFLDLDGVLCDMVRPLLRLCGVPALRVEQAHSEIDSWGSLVKVIDRRSTDAFLENEESLWSWVDYSRGSGFWSSLPPTPWMADLVEAANSGNALVRILSTPTRFPSSSSGKVQWVRERIDARAYGRLTLTREKHLLARHGRLLVDDAEHNVDAWIRAGGQAILWPQPWNRDRHVSVERALEAVREAVS